jgi:hypothetical protein
MRFFVDRPNIGFERLSLDCPSGQVVSRTSIDIMENGQSAIASNAAVGAAANLARGALDEVVETDLKGARGNGIDAPTLMTTAASLKIPVVMLRPGESGALKALSLPPMFEHAIGATLAAGQFALATQGPVMVAGAPHMAWWAVDPASGSAIGRVDDGGGQAMVEEIIQQANTTVSILNVMEFSFSLEGCVWRGATLAVQVEDFDVGACMARVVCVLMVQDATDYGLSMLGLLTEFEPTAETFEFMTNFLELTGGPDAPGPACGEGE